MVFVTILTSCAIQETMSMDPRRQSWPDAQLLRESEKDPGCFGIFYERHAQTILAYFYRRTSSAQLAADLAAETFAQAYLSRSRFRDRGVPATAWLYAIARRQLSHFQRRSKVEERARRRLGVERLYVDDEDIERIEALVDFEPLRTQVRQALDRLPSGIARAVQLRIGESLAFSEVAERLHCSEGAARVRVSRGLAQLARELEVD